MEAAKPGGGDAPVPLSARTVMQADIFFWNIKKAEGGEKAVAPLKPGEWRTERLVKCLLTKPKKDPADTGMEVHLLRSVDIPEDQRSQKKE